MILGWSTYHDRMLVLYPPSVAGGLAARNLIEVLDIYAAIQILRVQFFVLDVRRERQHQPLRRVFDQFIVR